jgi:hypothetical protein
MSIVIELILAAVFLASVHRQLRARKQPVAVRSNERR